MPESVSIEWLVGIARRHPDGGSYHDHSPWDAVATVVISGDSADIRGCHGTFTQHSFSLLRAELKKLGIRKITWDRYKTRRKTVSVDL